MTRLNIHDGDRHWEVDSVLLTVVGPFITYAGQQRPAAVGCRIEVFHALNLSALRTEYPYPVWQHMSNVVNNARRSMDPTHLLVDDAACWGCGALWDEKRVMVHAEDCAYLGFGQWSA